MTRDGSGLSSHCIRYPTQSRLAGDGGLNGTGLLLVAPFVYRAQPVSNHQLERR